MNKNTINSAIQKRERQQHGFKHWWHINGYKVMCVVLWFIWLPMLAHEKYKEHHRKNFVENSAKTQKLLDKVFPKMVSHYCGDGKVIIVMLGSDFENYANFCTEDFHSSYALPKRVRNYFSLLTSEQLKRMMVDYEIDGYEKRIVTCWQDWDEITKMFGWAENWNKDYDKAVVFYDPEKVVQHETD